MKAPAGTQPTGTALSSGGDLAIGRYVDGVRRGDPVLLARAITLIESTTEEHRAQARTVLERLAPHAGGAKRIGVTGVPGVGKSTFIEALGCFLCQRGHKVAVLAIDPTSVLSRGSILGDRTRMERLSREPNAFVRPSPSGGCPGGLAARTREALLLCEAAGFDVVLIETVGVGQGEVTLRSVVDFVVLLLLAGAGDELQALKRGITETADAVLVTKADGDNRARAETARSEQASALHHIAPATPGWRPPVSICSALTGEGVPEFWSVVERFYAELQPIGAIDERRRAQVSQCLDDLLQEEIVRRFHGHPVVRRLRPEVEAALFRGEINAFRAMRTLLEAADGVTHPPVASSTGRERIARQRAGATRTGASRPELDRSSRKGDPGDTQKRKRAS